MAKLAIKSTLGFPASSANVSIKIGGNWGNIGSGELDLDLTADSNGQLVLAEPGVGYRDRNATVEIVWVDPGIQNVHETYKGVWYVDGWGNFSPNTNNVTMGRRLAGGAPDVYENAPNYMNWVYLGVGLVILGVVSYVVVKVVSAKGSVLKRVASGFG